MTNKKDVTKEVKEVHGSLDLKESLEMLKAIDLFLSSMQEALKDGKIDWKDTLIGLKLLNNFKVFAEAAKGAGLIPDELKDLDSKEIVILAQEIYPLLKKVKEIVLKLKEL